MSGLYYLIFGVAILVIIRWCWNNDKGREQDGTEGFLAMRAAKRETSSPESSERLA